MAFLSPSTFLASMFWSFFKDPTNTRGKKIYKPDLSEIVHNTHGCENKVTKSDKMCDVPKARENASRWRLWENV